MAVAPVIRISEFALSGVNPSGARHAQVSASGFVKNLGTTAGTLLDFGSVNNTTDKKTSDTKVIIMNVDDMKDATEAVFNMRFWISNFDDWDDGTFWFNGFASGVWLQNLVLNEASGFFVPTALPSGQNLFRQDGNTEITGSGADSQSSYWIYLSNTVDIDVDPGTYGGTDGGFIYRITSDYR